LTPVSAKGMKRFVLPLIMLGVAGALLWRYPPVRIRQLAEVRAAQAAAGFDAATFARKFWDEQLKPAQESAASAAELVAAIRQDPKQARNQFGRSVGMSRSYFYFVRGVGTVVSSDNRRIALDVDGAEETAGEKAADVSLQTGLIFGNAVRDATGLLDASDYPNLKDFNAIAQELNRLAEAEVARSPVKNAAVGSQVEFVGCAEVRSEPGDLRPLKVIPISVTVGTAAESDAKAGP
jgi:predicted lipoprotein